MAHRRRVVWKFPIEVGPGFITVLEMPKGSRLLTVQRQGSVYCLWAEVDADPEAPKTERLIHSVRTGGPFTDSPSEYVTTVFEGPFVWHIYDEGERPPRS